jgi:hypothetical protein
MVDSVDIWDLIDCSDCRSYTLVKGRFGGDPDNCYPEEELCAEGCFDDGHPCKRVLARIEEGIEDGEFETEDYDLVESSWMNDMGARIYYGEVFDAWAGVDWGERLYWQVYYDGRAPTGFDTAAEVYEKVFR